MSFDLNIFSLFIGGFFSQRRGLLVPPSLQSSDCNFAYVPFIPFLYCWTCTCMFLSSLFFFVKNVPLLLTKAFCNVFVDHQKKPLVVNFLTVFFPIH